MFQQLHTLVWLAGAALFDFCKSKEDYPERVPAVQEKVVRVSYTKKLLFAAVKHKKLIGRKV